MKAKNGSASFSDNVNTSWQSGQTISARAFGYQWACSNKEKKNTFEKNQKWNPITAVPVPPLLSDGASTRQQINYVIWPQQLIVKQKWIIRIPPSAVVETALLVACGLGRVLIFSKPTRHGHTRLAAVTNSLFSFFLLFFLTSFSRTLVFNILDNRVSSNAHVRPVIRATVAAFATASCDESKTFVERRLFFFHFFFLFLRTPQHGPIRASFDRPSRQMRERKMRSSCLEKKKRKKRKKKKKRRGSRSDAQRVTTHTSTSQYTASSESESLCICQPT